MDRVIFHIDMDAFFSSIEQLSIPSLKGKPVVVCGDPYRRSVVSTASYEARKYGLKSGMPIGLARKLCPHGIFITGNPKKYVYTSVRVLGILREFSLKVEPFSVDEAFIEFNDLGIDQAIPLAQKIKQRIKHRVDLSCSIGVGPNKIIAKMASDVDKPDGLTLIRREEFQDFFGERTVRILWGVGEKTVTKLSDLGITTVRELAHYPEATLRKIFGEYGTYLKMTANGIDDSPVIPYYKGIEPKSIGHEYTLVKDTCDKGYLLSTLLRLCEQVARRMRKDGFVCNTVTVKIRFKNFKTITRQKKLAKYTERDDILFKVAGSLFLSNFYGDEIRLLGVSATGLFRKTELETEPIFEMDRRLDNCLQAVDTIRDRFGEDSITRGGTIRT